MHVWRAQKRNDHAAIASSPIKVEIRKQSSKQEGIPIFKTRTTFRLCAKYCVQFSFSFQPKTSWHRNYVNHFRTQMIQTQRALCMLTYFCFLRWSEIKTGNQLSTETDLQVVVCFSKCPVQAEIWTLQTPRLPTQWKAIQNWSGQIHRHWTAKEADFQISRSKQRNVLPALRRTFLGDENVHTDISVQLSNDEQCFAMSLGHTQASLTKSRSRRQLQGLWHAFCLRKLTNIPRKVNALDSLGEGLCLMK